MDHSLPSNPTSPVKTASSAIPRFSRLPTLKPIPAAPPLVGQEQTSQLTSPVKPSSARPSPVKPSIPQPTSSSISKRSSLIGTPSRLPPPRTTAHRSTQSVQISNNRSSVYGQRPESRPGSRLARPTSTKFSSSHSVARHEDSDDQLGSLGGFRASSRQSFRTESPFPENDDLSVSQAETPPRVKKSSRPSLSDRTVESILRLPPTPVTERRRSSFFPPPSPMGPPSRPASALSATMRPGSSDGGFVKPSARPASPAKRPLPSAKATNRMSGDSAAVKSTPSRQSTTVAAPRPLQTTSRASQQSSIGKPLTSSRVPNGTTASRIPGTPSAAASRTTDSRTGFRTSTVKRPTVAPASTKSRDRAESPTPRTQPPAKVPSSSSTLRDQIAQAKAAKRVAAMKSGTTKVDNSGGFEFDLTSDPFNAKPKDNKGLLMKRIDAARADGRLNIAAMGLKDIPGEVLRMYDSDEMAKSNITWSETVDLTRFMAADNEFEIVSDNIFPDIDTDAADQEDEDSAQTLQFRGLEVLDLHGNMLTAIPAGLRRLERLKVLNLSHNKLNNTAWDVLSQLETVEELRLGHNNFTAYLPQKLNRLCYLRTLDLQSNKLLSLPEGLRELVNLRVLNVSSNQLTGIPMDALESLPLTDLNVSNNAMVGALFGFSVNGLSSLESLDVSNNSLASLAFSDNLALPALKTLNIANNRIAALPDVSGWKKLVSLAAADNKIAQLPIGFPTLEHLRHADFTGNDLARLPEEIGLMECLDVLNIAANPIKERKLLSLTTELLKRDLRSRLKSDRNVATEEDFEDEGIDIQSPGQTQQPWKLSSGVLDLTNKDLVNEDADELRSFLGANHEVRELILARNPLSVIPFEISMAQNLRVLDISNCALSGDYLLEMVNFQFLKELNLSGNKISSWDPLLESFLAPRLEVLDVSNNRLVGSVPDLKASYPALKTLHTRDNRIDAVSREALEGLHAVDLSNNNIGYLPPEIGLLWELGLKGFNVSGNAFRVPNYRVLEKGTEATLAYLREKIPGSAGLDEETF